MYLSHPDSQLEVKVAIVLVAVESMSSSFPAKVVMYSILLHIGNCFANILMI